MLSGSVAILVDQELPLSMAGRVGHAVDDHEKRLATALKPGRQRAVHVVGHRFEARLPNEVVGLRVLAGLKIDADMDDGNAGGIAVPLFVILHDAGFHLTGGCLAVRSPPGKPLQKNDLAGVVTEPNWVSRGAIDQSEILDDVPGLISLSLGERTARPGEKAEQSDPDQDLGSPHSNHSLKERDEANLFSCSRAHVCSLSKLEHAGDLGDPPCAVLVKVLEKRGPKAERLVAREVWGHEQLQRGPLQQVTEADADLVSFHSRRGIGEK